MPSFVLRRRLAPIAAAAAVLIPFVFVHPALADGDAGDGTGVARLSFISGSVAVQRGDATSPTTAVVNAPVLGGDYVTTGDGARAEVELDGASLVRLGQNVQMRFTHLDNDQRAIQLAEGTIDLRLLRGTDGRSDIDTPSVTVRPRAGGDYRVTVTPDGQTLVTVRSGDAAIVTPQGERALTPGTTLFAQGPASSPSITTQDAIALDDFDRFVHERDARYERVVADSGYVDRNITGTGDLNEYGRWVADPTYGQVWTPTNVASDWAPYRDGRWVWEDGFGWTWVGYEPWGWAPYHYGAWYHSPAYGWCWYPPRPAPIVPLWRPALVAFFSFGGGTSWGVGYGNGFGFNIGWVPLAPYEPWHPWWHRGWGGNTTIVNNTTVINNNYYGNVNNGQLTRIYHNAQYGVTTVPGQRFLEGRFDHPAVVRPGAMRNVDVVRGALPVVPSAANLRYSERPVAPQLAVRPTTMQRTFAGDAAPVRRIPFEQQRAAIATVTHQPYTPVTPHAAFAPSAARPDLAAPHATRALTTTGAVPAGVGSPSTMHAVTDPWARFGTNRGTPAANLGPATQRTVMPIRTNATGELTRPGTRLPETTTVTRTMNGTATTYGTGVTTRAGAWNRFDNGTTGAPRADTVTRTARPYAPAAGAQPPANRVYEGAPARPTTRTYGGSMQGPRAYDAPMQTPRSSNAPAGTSAPSRTMSGPRPPARSVNSERGPHSH